MIIKEWEFDRADALEDAVQRLRSNRTIEYDKVQELLLSCERRVLEQLRYGDYDDLFDGDKRQKWCFTAGVVVMVEAALKRLEAKLK